MDATRRARCCRGAPDPQGERLPVSRTVECGLRGGERQKVKIALSPPGAFVGSCIWPLPAVAPGFMNSVTLVTQYTLVALADKGEMHSVILIFRGSKSTCTVSDDS